MKREETPLHTDSAVPTILPEFRQLPPPIIVIGMHRSGTSLVAGLLSLLGVYCDPKMPPPPADAALPRPGNGARVAGYGEAQAFRLLNERLLRQAGSAWDNVDDFLMKRDDPQFASASLSAIQSATYRELKTDYLDMMPPLESSGWGWKDPVNSLTAPYWLRIFPDATLIHVVRDPRDVAASLVRRAQKQEEQFNPTVLTRALRWVSDPRIAARGIVRRVGQRSLSAPPKLSVSDPAYCLNLYDRYVSECLTLRRTAQRYYEIHFEQILASPLDSFHQLADMVGQKATGARARAAIDFIDTDRRGAEAVQTAGVACRA